MNRRRLLVAAAGVAVVAATFAWILPQVADYEDVWSEVRALSWPWIVALLAATVVNLATFAPPWLAVLPGLRFFQALELTQAATALSVVVPGGVAAGIAASFAMLTSWGFRTRDTARALTVVGLWNQLLNLAYPVIALFLLLAAGEETAVLATVAFVGACVFGVTVAGLVLVLWSGQLAHEIGDVAARLVTWAKRKLRRGPPPWDGTSFERFRAHTRELLARRWHLLTLASVSGSLSVFAVFLVSLRALGVPSSDVSLAEAFAAWSLVRLLGTIPITPGGIGIVELGLTTALVAFGGDNSAVVAAVLVYRFLTLAPTIVYGLVATATWRRHRKAAVELVP